LDLLGGITFFKPFKCILKKTNYIKNSDNFKKYKNLVEEEIQLHKVVLNSIKVIELEEKLSELDISLKTFTDKIERIVETAKINTTCRTVINDEIEFSDSNDRVNRNIER